LNRQRAHVATIGIPDGDGKGGVLFNRSGIFNYPVESDSTWPDTTDDAGQLNFSEPSTARQRFCRAVER
jgi:hypothetical protein